MSFTVLPVNIATKAILDNAIVLKRILVSCDSTHCDGLSRMGTSVPSKSKKRNSFLLSSSSFGFLLSKKYLGSTQFTPWAVVLLLSRQAYARQLGNELPCPSINVVLFYHVTHPLHSFSSFRRFKSQRKLDRIGHIFNIVRVHNDRIS